jgi:hypothetical protein
MALGDTLLADDAVLDEMSRRGSKGTVVADENGNIQILDPVSGKPISRPSPAPAPAPAPVPQPRGRVAPAPPPPQRSVSAPVDVVMPATGPAAPQYQRDLDFAINSAGRDYVTPTAEAPGFMGQEVATRYAQPNAYGEFYTPGTPAAPADRGPDAWQGDLTQGDLAAYRQEQQRQAEAREAVAVPVGGFVSGKIAPEYKLVQPGQPQPQQAGVPLEDRSGFDQTRKDVEDAQAQLSQANAGIEAPQTVGMIGGVGAAMDPRMAQGVAYQQAALADLAKAYAGEEKGISELEAKYMSESDKYKAGLEKLKGQREAMGKARGVERAIEAQDVARSEMRFDANRVYESLAQSPVQLGAMAIAAGIVQGLQGYAGQDKPNVILQGVEDAARRDVMNQVEQYKRMMQGQDVAKNAFIEARQQLGDEQQALQVATMASLDQIAKGLEFAKARMIRAKDRADIDRTIGQLQYEIGKAGTDLRIKNAELGLQRDISNQRTHTELAKIQSDFSIAAKKYGQEQMSKAEQRVNSWATSEIGTNVVKDLDQIGRTNAAIRDAVRGGMPLNEVLDKNILDYVNGTISQIAAAKKGSAWEQIAANQFAETLDKVNPEKQAVLREIHNLFTSHLRQEAGKAQSIQETANQLQSAGLNTPQGVLSFIKRKTDQNRAIYNGQLSIANAAGDGAAKAIWQSFLGTKLVDAESPFVDLQEQMQKVDRLAGARK